MSLTRTVAPSATRKRARSVPSRASPMTLTRLPPSTVVFTTIRPRKRLDLDERQRHAAHRREYADQPESLGHVGLRPAAELEMVVERGHLEQALALGQLV